MKAAATGPTGEQFALHRGAARARIGQVAAVLREFSVGGIDYTETWPDDMPTPRCAGIVLAPWPNRVANARWTWRGDVQQLDITEPARGHAIHGLLRNTAYQPLALSADSVTLGAPIYPQHGWPFTLHTQVTYALTDRGLQVTHEAFNVGSEPALFACGAHPYLRIGEVPADELTLTLRADSYVATDDALIPTGTQPLPAALAALRTGAPVAGLNLDTCFTGLQLRRGRIEHTVAAPDGHALTVWADPAFAWAQVFTPRGFPAAADPRGAIAIEPMTAPVDALNSGEGLITLEPGAVWRGSWGLTPDPPGTAALTEAPG